MRCRSCDKKLKDHEAVRKYDNWENITNGDYYIDLCDKCLADSDLSESFPDIYDYGEDDASDEAEDSAVFKW